MVGGLHGFYFIFTYLSCNQQFEANALVPYQLQHIGSRVGCHRIIFENFINLEVRKKENLTTHQKKKKKKKLGHQTNTKYITIIMGI